MKVSIYDWVKDKKEEIKIEPLVPEIENSGVLVNALRELAEEGFECPIPSDWSEEDMDKKLDRLFCVHINKKALELMHKRGVFLYSAANKMEKQAELLDDIDENTPVKEELRSNAKIYKKEADDLIATAATIHQGFKESAQVFVDTGERTGWYDDKEEVMKIIDAIPIAEEKENGNILTVSSLIAKIDDLIAKIDDTIHRIEMLLENAKDKKQTQDVDQDNEKVCEELCEDRKDAELLGDKAETLDNSDEVISAKTATILEEDKRIKPTKLEPLNDNGDGDRDISNGVSVTLDLDTDSEVERTQEKKPTPPVAP